MSIFKLLWQYDVFFALLVEFTNSKHTISVVPNYTFSGSLMPPLVMIYVASRSGQSTSSQHRYSIVEKGAYLVNQ